MPWRRREQRAVAIGGLDEDLRVPGAPGLGLERLNRGGAGVGLYRQVAVKGESLAVHAGGHQREHDRRWPDERHDDDPLAMGLGDE